MVSRVESLLGHRLMDAMLTPWGVNVGSLRASRRGRSCRKRGSRVCILHIGDRRAYMGFLGDKESQRVERARALGPRDRRLGRKLDYWAMGMETVIESTEVSSYALKDVGLG